MLLDTIDQDLLSINWYIHKIGKHKYYTANVDGTKVRLHRLVASRCSDIVGKVVDHINGDTLDNRRSNLRIVTVAANCRNKGTSVNTTTGYKGVSVDRRRLQRPYKAHIQVDGKQISLGTFSNPVDAAKAYDTAAKEYFGQYARTNKNLGLI